MPAGVDTNGFTKKTIEDIKKEIEDDLLSNLGPDTILASNQPIGQINAAFSKKAAELWEVAEIAYNGFDRDASEGRQLDNVGALTGTPREAERKTQVKVTLNLGAGFSHGPGELMAHVVNNADAKFVNKNAVTSTTAGNYTGIVFEAVLAGPVVANAGTLTQITNGVSGWNSVTNPEDGVLGALIEEDDDYRVRQREEITAPGASTVDAVEVDVLQVAGVQQATCYENVTMITDENGVPAKAIEVIIFDGIIPQALDTEVAQAIWNSKPSGSETFGGVTSTAIDKKGRVRTVKFSRATIRNVYLEYDVKVDATRFPVDGLARIKDAAVAKGDNRDQDDDVVALAMRACVLEPVVPGVVDVRAMRLGFSASPTNTENLSISVRERADFDTSRIIVNLV